VRVSDAAYDDLLARRGSWSAASCSVAAALEVVGTRSAMLLMREAFYGTRRFDDFAHRVGISDAVAAARLRELVEAGLLAKVPRGRQPDAAGVPAHRQGPRPAACRARLDAVGRPVALGPARRSRRSHPP